MNNDEDDTDLFRQMMSDVKPLKTDGNKVPAVQRKPKPFVGRHAEREEYELDDLMASRIDESPDTTEQLTFVRSGMQSQVLKKLRRGQYASSHELDLHGMTADHAYIAIQQFIEHCRGPQMSSVRIIHGKGDRSERGPVLKRKLGGWLRQRDDVLAFCSAKENDGGTGAVYVLLKRRANTE